MNPLAKHRQRLKKCCIHWAMYLYLGIDGGGTKTRCLIVNQDGDYIGSSIAGPSNLSTNSIQTVAHTCRPAVKRSSQSRISP